MISNYGKIICGETGAKTNWNGPVIGLPMSMRTRMVAARAGEAARLPEVQESELGPSEAV
jgi:hypothetical protein